MIMSNYGTQHYLTDWMRERYSDVVPDHVLSHRFTKNAMGMTKTMFRSRHSVSNRVLVGLSIRGTMACSLGISIYANNVASDDGATKLVLSDLGRIRVKRMRMQRNNRLSNARHDAAKREMTQIISRFFA